jgi:hypothetical protein
MTTIEDFNNIVGDLINWLRETGFPGEVKDIDDFEKKYSERIMSLEEKLLSAYGSKEINDEEYRERCMVIDDVSATVRTFIDKKRKEKMPHWINWNSMMNQKTPLVKRTRIQVNNPDELMSALPEWMPEEQKREIVSMIKGIVNNSPFNFFIPPDKDDDGNNKW